MAETNSDSMEGRSLALIHLLFCAASGSNAESLESIDMEPAGRGPYSVGSTNMEVTLEYADIGDEAMHNVLLGRAEDPDDSRFLPDILKYPESAWVVDVPIPDESEIYGPASGQSLPVAVFLTYPSSESQAKNAYTFPYHDGRYGVFEDMLDAGEAPRFADPDERYPLVILAHGSSAHGLFDVGHAQSLASHGYIVAVLTYGDDRTAIPDDPSFHVGFLRPLLTKGVLDSILASETFGAHIDTDNIGISGHSFGGFTALAMTGGLIQGNTATVSDKRIKAGVIAAPWVGGHYEGSDHFAFGPNNSGLDQVTAAMICFFSWKDEATQASFILPAMKRLSGPSYVVELVDQPHVFEDGSWEDRDAWELLFLSAYLKDDTASLAALKTGRSMKGGNEDVQHFDYQRVTGND
jgi:hypothetical protein